MAQYDIYVNPNSRSRESVPFVVDIQSSFIDVLCTHLDAVVSGI